MIILKRVFCVLLTKKMKWVDILQIIREKYPTYEVILKTQGS
ncbi:hypothetical protein MTBBW1_1220013 [Desulfamplus magnetovallimortis]|uniref:Uncharacterized protein n=1 Tax=Desulfamplus magnetovallimortis TaxID=1246637 RepID=A0A1W1H6C0_9BACT|nr:hypothetical protein MTBBW1_1220013 [Desulfamplus magnetovallimortis]